VKSDQPYLVPAGNGEALLVEKRSKFTARVWPVADEAEALLHISQTKETYWDATHNVYAYIIKDGPTRFSDDGEPHGTSGMPTLNVFKNNEIFNVCCVVTRYYGGVLLGAGGLVRAYSSAAKMALDAAGKCLMRLWDVVLLACPYPLFEQMKLLVQSASGVVQSAEYGVDIMIEAMLPIDETQSFLAGVQELSSGQVEPEVIDTVFRGATVS
jgi:Uncharacterized conserved protein